MLVNINIMKTNNMLFICYPIWNITFIFSFFSLKNNRFGSKTQERNTDETCWRVTQTNQIRVAANQVTNQQSALMTTSSKTTNQFLSWQSLMTANPRTPCRTSVLRHLCLTSIAIPWSLTTPPVASQTYSLILSTHWAEGPQRSCHLV